MQQSGFIPIYGRYDLVSKPSIVIGSVAVACFDKPCAKYSLSSSFQSHCLLDAFSLRVCHGKSMVTGVYVTNGTLPAVGAERNAPWLLARTREKTGGEVTNKRDSLPKAKAGRGV
jgi:hypothetical protein